MGRPVHSPPMAVDGRARYRRGVGCSGRAVHPPPMAVGGPECQVGSCVLNGLGKFYHAHLSRTGPDVQSARMTAGCWAQRAEEERAAREAKEREVCVCVCVCI